MTDMSQIGRPARRYEGVAKVTGAAKYAAEFDAPDLAHGCVLSAPIAKGQITRIDAAEALALPGVLTVLTHENRPSLAWFDRSYQDDVAPPGAPFRALHGGRVLYSGQPVALVVAETLEVARHAATLVRIDYEAEAPETDLDAKRHAGYEPRRKRSGISPPPPPRGDVFAALEQSALRQTHDYVTPIEHHNPMEPHATTVVWDDDEGITVYDKTQGVQNSQNFIVSVFGLSKDKVRVVSPYLGGAFGSGLRPQYQLTLAVMAARELKRSVRVELTRRQMFSFSYRPGTRQTVSLGVDAGGLLTAIEHEALAMTSHFEDYQENVVNWSGLLYRCANASYGYRLAQLDLASPADMRAPGGALGLFALESAIDEMAHQAGLDPVEMRLRNYADHDQNEDKPFSSKKLRECFLQGAERFGWEKRSAAPRSMRDGRELVGWGMATGIWEAMQVKSAARATLSPDGMLEIASAVSDIGTGTYTIMRQVAAATLGLPPEHVTVKLGDSSLPAAPVQGGSWTAASTGSAVQAVCELMAETLLERAQRLNSSPLAGAKRDQVVFAQGRIALRDNPDAAVAIADLLRDAEPITEETAARPGLLNMRKYTSAAHSAVFAEVKVDEEFGVVRVTRVVSAVAAGQILNPRTARSQIIGGVVWGIGMALQEETLTDHRFGRFLNSSLADYHIPVNADVHDIDVIFVDEPDPHINPLGVKGVGEIGVVGTAAAIANAVFHATGVRVRTLPITLDKLLPGISAA